MRYRLKHDQKMLLLMIKLSIAVQGLSVLLLKIFLGSNNVINITFENNIPILWLGAYCLAVALKYLAQQTISMETLFWFKIIEMFYNLPSNLNNRK